MKIRVLAVLAVFAMVPMFVGCGGGDGDDPATDTTVEDTTTTDEGGPAPTDEGGPAPTDEGGPVPTDEGGPVPTDEGTEPVDGAAAEDSQVSVTDEGSQDIPPEPTDVPTGPPDDVTVSDSPTWTEVISVKFSQSGKCGGCHTGGNSGGHNCLSNYQDCLKASTSCNGKTVGECLMDRIEDGTMPPNGGFIPPDWKTELQSWIDAGMPE